MGVAILDGGLMKRATKALETIAAGSSGSPAVLDQTFGAMLDGANTTSVFHHWWPIARAHDQEIGENRYHTLERWFTMLQNAMAGKYYTLRFGDYRVNTTGVTTMTPMGDLAGKTASACVTESSAVLDEWIDEDPMVWYIRGNALSLQDGTMNILSVEGIDDDFDISGNTAPVYTFRLGLFKRWFTDGTYEYKVFATKPEAGFAPWAADVDPETNGHRVMDWQATFGGSLTSGGKLTSGSGYASAGRWERNSNTPAWRRGATTGLTDARKWDAYEGVYSDTDLEPILDLWQLRHFDLENSNILNGCTDYNYQYIVAAAEENVLSVLLAPSQAANLLIGGCVELGTHAEGTNTNRDTGGNYDLVGCATIVAMDEVTIEEETFTRVHLDIPQIINVPATAYLSTMPWVPGSTERLPGRKDGCLYSLPGGKTPARIAGVEIIDGAYCIGLDPLWNHTYDASASPTDIYTVYQCRNSEHQSGSITANHVESGSFTNNGSARSWQYQKHMEIRTDGMMVPDVIGGSGSTFMKSAFHFGGSSGVRAPWRFGALSYGAANCGLACAYGSLTPSAASWTGRPRLSGSGKKRGEWQAALAA